MDVMKFLIENMIAWIEKKLCIGSIHNKFLYKMAMLIVIIVSIFGLLMLAGIFLMIFVLLRIAGWIFLRPSNETQTNQNINMFFKHSTEMMSLVVSVEKNALAGTVVDYGLDDSVIKRLSINYIEKEDNGEVRFVIDDDGFMSLNYRAYIYSESDINHIDLYADCCTYEYNQRSKNISDDLYETLSISKQYNYNLKVKLSDNRYYVEEFDG